MTDTLNLDISPGEAGSFPPLSSLLSIREAAGYIGYTVSTIRRYASTHPERLPPFLRLPGKIYFLLSDILKWRQDLLGPRAIGGAA